MLCVIPALFSCIARYVIWYTMGMKNDQTLFSGKTLLITGGTGSFGHAVLNRFLNTDIREIRIFSRDEKKQDDMRHALQNQKVKYYIGDIRDRQSVDGAMEGVDYVFSAAALKQVPSCEFFPLQAVQTNVLGTNNVIESAIAHGVGRVEVLSTDKAADQCYGCFKGDDGESGDCTWAESGRKR